MTRSTDWWDGWFLGLASYISTASKDPSTQVGCVIVGPDREIRATGYNGFPRGVDDSEERLNNRELKYSLVVHAEENSLLYAARVGVSLKGCTAYVTWPPCTRCAVSMIQAGIVEVIYPSNIEIPERWKKDFELSNSVLNEAFVRVKNSNQLSIFKKSNTSSVDIKLSSETNALVKCHGYCGGTLVPKGQIFCEACAADYKEDPEAYK